MNESEIRERLNAAFGESSYPPNLTHLVATRLEHSRPRGAQPAILGLVAALLALAIVLTLVLVRLQYGPTVGVPEATPRAIATTPSLPPGPHIPQADLDRAQLDGANDLVSPFNLSATSSGRTITLIGAYADSARTVFFFRSLPAGAFAQVLVYDDNGFLNASGSGGRGSFGDVLYALDAGPHVGSDGLAHLKVTVDSFAATSPSGLQLVHGDWTFNISLKPQTSRGLTLSPALGSVGSWKFTIEALDVSATLVHFQAVIDGAAVADIQPSTITLLDSSGSTVPPVTYGAGSTTSRSTRINVSWARPTNAGTYVLQVIGGGSQYRGTVNLPGSGIPTKKEAGAAPRPTDYPGSSEALRLDGPLSASITSGQPTECGSGTGPSGTIFAFATYFQVDGAWYLIVFSTVPSQRQYSGPGTYPVKATIYPYGPMGADAIFDGTAQLTVTSDKRPGPVSGSVQGTLAWTAPADQQYAVNVSGNWTCTWSQQLGPG